MRNLALPVGVEVSHTETAYITNELGQAHLDAGDGGAAAAGAGSTALDGEMALRTPGRSTNDRSAQSEMGHKHGSIGLAGHADARRPHHG